MEEELTTQARQMAFIPLEKALRQEHCPICRRLREDDEQRIWTLLYEQTGDPPLRKLFDQSLGFCQYHGHLAISVVRERELMTGSNVARLYETVAKRYQHMLQELSRARQGARALRRNSRLLQKMVPEECIVCHSSQQTLAGAVTTLLGMLSFEEYRSAYIRSAGLCNPHFSVALRQADSETRQLLLEDQKSRMAALERKLYELQRKQSYDMHEAATTEEENSWKEAIWRFSGVSWDELLIKRKACKPENCITP